MGEFEPVISLDGAWKLYFAEDDAVSCLEHPPQTIGELESCGFACVEAHVPGNVEDDLKRAGLIGDPFIGSNIYQCHALENNHYWYVRVFQADGSADMALRLGGLDTYGEVFLNSRFAGKTDNMLVPHILPLSGVLQGENELVIHIEPTVLRARQTKHTMLNSTLQYGYDGLGVRKAPYMFGWDIMPRLVSAGLWKSVTLVRHVSPAFKQCYLYTRKLSCDGAELELFYELELGKLLYGKMHLRITLSDGENERVVETSVWSAAGHMRFTLKAPRLWYPRGYGEPFMYSARAELLDGKNNVLCIHKFSLGIRTVRLDRRQSADAENSEFRFVVNGVPVYVLGTNWVPLDALPSRFDGRLEKAIALTLDIGCNAIRCWGGNAYESEDFYRLCDENGLLVWQDFSMACGSYPSDEQFLRTLEGELRTVIRERRQHPCICMWAGDNECDMSYVAMGCNPNRSTVSRRFIADIEMQEDCVRPYLPSSPYYDESVAAGAPPVEEHLWGKRVFFDVPYYTDARVSFISEIGYHGCPCPESIKKFIEPEHLTPAPDDEQWLLHASSPVADESAPFGYRIRLMFTQIENFCGEKPNNLDTFALYSQISQAEAMKTFIESARSRRGKNNGIIWWNILDGCPQFSDAVVDYYFRRKLAYGYIRTAQSPLLLLIRKDSDSWALYAVNDTPESREVAYSVSDFYSGSNITAGTAVIAAGTAARLEALPLDGSEVFCRIGWESGEISGVNHRYTGSYPLDIERYIHAAAGLGLLNPEGFGESNTAVKDLCKADVGRYL